MTTYNAQLNKYVRISLFSLLLVGAFAVVFIPNAAKADFNPLNPLDPFCLWSCKKSQPTVSNVTTNNTNSNNVNSYNNTTTNNQVNGPVSSPTPVYVYNTNSPLSVSCYSSPTSVNTDQSVVWNASANGGNGSYYYSWSGSDGLSGSGQSIYRTYNNPGSKTAVVTVTSDGQTISRNCDNSVVVYGYDNYNYNNNYYPYNYNPNYYGNSGYNNYYPYNYYSTISASCSANVTYTSVGSYVYWTAYATGGNGYYTYSWNGTDSLYGSQMSASMYYNNPGVKYAYVSVYSGGQQTTVQCSNTVNVGGYNYNYNYNTYPTTYYPVQNGVQIACFADATTVRVGVPVTWAVEATGLPGNLTYAWTGSDGLSGNQSSIITTYVTPGTKSAVVTVTGSNGQSSAKACGNTVYVKGATAYKAPVKKVVVAPVEPAPVYQVNPNPGLSGASLLSLGNVPWGWVAIMVILVLFGTVLFLLFSKGRM